MSEKMDTPFVALETRGHFLLKGRIDFHNAPDLLEKGFQLLDENPKLSLDFSSLEGAQSVILALFLEWQRRAEKLNKPIEFNHIPKFLWAIFELSNLQTILKLSREGHEHRHS